MVGAVIVVGLSAGLDGNLELGRRRCRHLEVSPRIDVALDADGRGVQCICDACRDHGQRVAGNLSGLFLGRVALDLDVDLVFGGDPGIRAACDGARSAERDARGVGLARIVGHQSEAQPREEVVLNAEQLHRVELGALVEGRSGARSNRNARVAGDRAVDRDCGLASGDLVRGREGVGDDHVVGVGLDVRGKDDVSASVILLQGHADSGESGVDGLIPGDVHNARKIDLAVRKELGAGLDVDLGGPQHDAAACVDRALDLDAFCRILRIDFVQVRRRVEVLAAHHVKGIVVNERLVAAVAQLLEQVRGRHDRRELARVDHARGADRHAFGAEEKEMPVNAIGADRVHRAGDVDALVDEIHEAVGVDVRILLIEVQVGDFTGGQLELVELVDAHFSGERAVDHVLRMQVVDLLAGINERGAVQTRDRGACGKKRNRGERAGKKPCEKLSRQSGRGSRAGGLDGALAPCLRDFGDDDGPVERAAANDSVYAVHMLPFTLSSGCRAGQPLFCPFPSGSLSRMR